MVFIQQPLPVIKGVNNLKLLILNNLYYPFIVGGAERSVQFLAEALATQGHQVTVACINTGHSRVIQQLNGVRLRYFDFRELCKPRYDNEKKRNFSYLFWNLLDLYNPWTTLFVSRILKEDRPDLVHTNNMLGFSTSCWTAVKKSNLPLVHTLRDYYLLCPNSSMFRKNMNCRSQCLHCKIITRPRRYISRLVDAVVGNSQFILERHLQFGYFSTTTNRHIIHNIYSPFKTNTLRRSRKAHLRLGFIGRLQPKKGIVFLSSVIKSLAHKPLQLFVAGSNEASEVTKLLLLVQILSASDS